MCMKHLQQIIEVLQVYFSVFIQLGYEVFNREKTLDHERNQRLRIKMSTQRKNTLLYHVIALE